MTLLIAMAGCGGDPIGCDPCRTQAIVYGSLTGVQDNDVSGRNVSVVAHAGSCGTTWKGGVDLVTDAQGDFRRIVSSPYSPFTTECLTVTVHGENGNQDLVRELPMALEFRAESDPARLDSVRIDVGL